MSITRRLLLLLVLLMACVSRGEAHAFLDHAEPGVGSVVPAAPSVIKIWFTRRVKPDESTIAIFDVAGHEIKAGMVRLDPDDPTLLSVTVPSMAVGTYKVAWKAVCFDSHVTHGSFTFEVGSK
jgi:methionine-rich copper-binding protein CopC